MKPFLLCLAIASMWITSCRKDVIPPSPQPVETPVITEPNQTTAISADNLIVDGYASRYTIDNDGDSLEVYINASSLTRNCRFNVYTAKGIIADYVFADSIMPQKITNGEPYKNGYGYAQKVVLRFTKPLLSGVYTISKKIFFVVRNKAKSGQLAVLMPTNTHMAYNTMGGGGLYTSGVTTVSSQRPWKQDKFSAEFTKWNDTPYGFDYYSDLDMDDYSNLEPYKLLVIIGHSEYWTYQAHQNLKKFIADGHNVLVLSGNTLWWQVRYSEDKTQMICYKKLDDPLTSGVMETTQFSKIPGEEGYKTIGSDFNFGGYANKLDSGWNGFKVLAPDNPLFAGTNVHFGDTISCVSNELDGAPTKRIAGYAHPVLDTAQLPFYKMELLAYDYGSRNGAQTVGTFIAMQKTPTSGVVVNVGNTDWCGARGFMGPHGAIIRQITKNAIYQMYTCHNVFTN